MRLHQIKLKLFNFNPRELINRFYVTKQKKTIKQFKKKKFLF